MSPLKEVKLFNYFFELNEPLVTARSANEKFTWWKHSHVNVDGCLDATLDVDKNPHSFFGQCATTQKTEQLTSNDFLWCFNFTHSCHIMGTWNNYNEYDISDECPMNILALTVSCFKNDTVGVNMHSYATYNCLFWNKGKLVRERKWVLVEADVRGGGMRDEPKQHLCRRLPISW